jgi:hypothetical protein
VPGGNSIRLSAGRAISNDGHNGAFLHSSRQQYLADDGVATTGGSSSAAVRFARPASRC